MGVKKLKRLSCIIYAIIITAAMLGCSGGAEKTIEIRTSADKTEASSNSNSSIITAVPPNLDAKPGSPLYVNRRAGAAHMLQKPAANGFYYAYDSAPNDTWPVHKSKDMIHWNAAPGKTSRPIGTWGQKNFWVPQMIEFNNKYYMFYCAREDANFPTSRIGLAISDSPEGPFKDIGHPVFDGTMIEDWHIIDPEPFIDPDTGKKYMYFSKDGSEASYMNERFKTEVAESHIFGVELTDDMMSIAGEPVELLKPSQEWEYKSFTASRKRLWNEAPEMIKRGDTYYLMYSANLYTTADYGLGVAVSKSPLGPFIKYENNPVTGSTATSKKAGHNSITESPDGKEFFTSYTTLEDGRYLSRIGFRDDGSMYVNGPIKGYQEAPSGSTNYKNYAKDAVVKASSTKAPYSLQAINDGEIGIYDRLEKYEWCSDNEKNGAWVQLSWDKQVKAETILIYDSAVGNRQLKQGHVILNGTEKPIYIEFPSAAGDPAVIYFSEGKIITSLKFIADDLRLTTGTVGLSEITVLGKK